MDAAIGEKTYRGYTVAYIFQKFQAYKYTIDQQRKQIEELVNSKSLLEHDLNEAINYAGGRETEWGDRAISAFQILENALQRQQKK